MISISVLNELEKSLGTIGMSDECAMDSVSDLLFYGNAALDDDRGDERAENDAPYAFERMINSVEDLNVDLVRFYFGLIAKSNCLGNYGENALARILLTQVCMGAIMRFREAVKYRRELLRCEALRVEIDDIEKQLIEHGVNPHTGQDTKVLHHRLSDESKVLLEALLRQQHPEYDSSYFGFSRIDTSSLEDYYDKNKLGYVYALENKVMGTVKIGKTKNPKSRIKNLQNTAGCKDDFFVWGEFYNYSDVELEAHSIFSKKNHMKEWFNVTVSEAKKTIKMLADKQPKPTKEQLAYSKIIDDYNGFCSYVGITTSFESLKANTNFVVEK